MLYDERRCAANGTWGAVECLAWRLLLGTLPCHRGQYHRRGHRASHRQDQLSATGRPSARRQRMSMWYPNDSNAVMLTYSFGRARCNRSNSCGLMSCVRLKGVEEVLSSLQQVINMNAAALWTLPPQQGPKLCAIICARSGRSTVGLKRGTVLRC